MIVDLRYSPVELKTVGELRAAIEGLADNLPIVRLTNGPLRVNRQDVTFWIGQLSIWREVELQECLRID